jgi:hypothetical protein
MPKNFKQYLINEAPDWITVKEVDEFLNTYKLIDLGLEEIMSAFITFCQSK